jgi:hypothetical protein
VSEASHPVGLVRKLEGYRGDQYPRPKRHDETGSSPGDSDVESDEALTNSEAPPKKPQPAAAKAPKKSYRRSTSLLLLEKLGSY